MTPPRAPDEHSHGQLRTIYWRWNDDNMARVSCSDNVKNFLSWNRPHNERSRFPAEIRGEVKNVSVRLRTTSRPCDARKSIARRCAGARAVRSRVFVWWGVASCVEHRRFRRLEPRRSSVTKVGRPTNLSATCLPTSQNLFFGSETLRRISLRLLRKTAVSAAFAKLSDISAGMSGPAMRLQPSCRKFLFVDPCATCG